MRVRWVEVIHGGLVVFVTAALATVAEAECKPVNGHSETQIVPCPAPLCTQGRLIGGLQGRLSLTATGLSPSGPTGLPTVSFFTGQSVIEAKDGSILVGTDTGAIDFATGKVATLITWVDGTGKFAGASGQIR
jgi:hypothetical protein